MNPARGWSGTLTGRQRAWRAALASVLAALFLSGTFVGDDPWWPFGPWRMFSTSTKPSGSVASTILEVRTADDPQTWTRRWFTPSSVGINRAEVEGRLPQIIADPSMLATLAASHRELRPGESPWIALRVVTERHVLDAGKPTGEITRQIRAEWSSP